MKTSPIRFVFVVTVLAATVAACAPIPDEPEYGGSSGNNSDSSSSEDPFKTRAADAGEKIDAAASSRASNADASQKPPAPSTSCCEAKGLCVPKDLLPEPDGGGGGLDVASFLKADTCASGSLCAPSELASPDFKPASCAGPGKSGKTGVCLSNCLNFGSFGSIALQQSTCDANHTCVPCSILGKPTGAPGCN